MSGILGLMDIAKRSLAATQLGVEVTSNNISNVNTPGYSRQIVRYETSTALPSAYGPLGYGVEVLGIERAFDPFVAARLVENTALLADYQSRQANLEQVASLFNETQDGGLSQLLSGFWDSWNDLADNPSGSGERQALLSQAQTLADAFNFRADQLVQARTALSQQIGPTIEEINIHAARIAELNRDIQAVESPEHQANDLRDERQKEINELAELVGVRYYTTGDGTVNVTLANGIPLVQSMDAWELGYEITADDKVQINWEGPNGLTEDVTSAVSGGRLSALIEVRDTQIVKFQEDLDNLAQELIATVNSQHSQGVGLDMFSEVTGTYSVANPASNLNTLPFGDRIIVGESFNIHVESGGTSTLYNIPINDVDGTTTLDGLINYINANVTGVTASLDPAAGPEYTLKLTADDPDDSFGFSEDTSNVLMALGVNTFFTGENAYGLAVNDTVADNYNLIATGQIETTPPNEGDHAPGDNRNALALAGLADQTVAGLGDLSFEDAFRQLVSDIALEAEDAGNKRDFYQGMVDQYSQLRDSVSGVSLDEELTNLIKYQRAYQAAAKMISAADEMLQALLTIKT